VARSGVSVKPSATLFEGCFCGQPLIFFVFSPLPPPNHWEWLVGFPLLFLFATLTWVDSDSFSCISTSVPRSGASVKPSATLFKGCFHGLPLLLFLVPNFHCQIIGSGWSSFLAIFISNSYMGRWWFVLLRLHLCAKEWSFCQELCYT